MSDDLKAKKYSVSRRPKKTKQAMSHGSTPIPHGPGSFAACGHIGCGASCRVHYVGSTTHLRDHHILHTARGVSNIWTAAVVTGLAVVLTGAIAFTVVQAKTDAETMNVQKENGLLRSENVRVLSRIEMMEKALQEIRELCVKPLVDEHASSTVTFPPQKLKTRK